jgi:hypothetical protein
MAIPRVEKVEGEPYALLPNGVYPGDDAQMYASFVRPFPRSRTRAEIWAGFQEMIRQPVLSSLGVSLWIDGSFVTGKLNPNDVNVVAFAKTDVLNKLTPVSQSKLRRLQDPVWSRPRFCTHLFVVAIYPTDDKRAAVSEALRCYWRKWWGETRGGTPKGFVSMTVGDPIDAPRSTLPVANDEAVHEYL